MSALARFLRVQTVMERTGLGRSTIYAMVARGDFPQPIKLGPRASAWLEAEVDDWQQRRVDASRSKAA